MDVLEATSAVVSLPTSVRVVDVVVDARSGGGDSTWTYEVGENTAEVGDAFLVPLGPRAVLAFVMRVYEATEESLGFPLKSLRAVLNKVDGVNLPPSVLALTSFVAEQYLCPMNVALTVSAPPGVRERLVTAWTLEENPPAAELTPLQKEVLRTMQDSGGSIQEGKGKKLPGASQRALKLLRAKGLVRQTLQFTAFAEAKAQKGLLRLSSDEAKVEAFLRKEGKKKPAQALTIMRLQAAEHSALSPAEIKALSGITDATIKALMQGGLLEQVEAGRGAAKAPPSPNPAQRAAIDAILEPVLSRQYKPFLLFGVTGSGKTEVFLRAAADTLKSGRQVLYLVPEIALAAQAVAQLRERFGERVAVLHSELPPKERLQNWMRIRKGDAPVVLGARSALFAPLTNIGLIIMDEEHETSYKQESAPRYHAKAVAKFLAQEHGAALVLGSATPSVETRFEAESGELTMLELPQRAAAQSLLPSVQVEDLTVGYKAGKPSILSEPLFRHMEATLARKEQIILFLNRRAYSPFLICRDCGKQFLCPRCSVSLAFSRRDQRLRCHHCGFNERVPEKCPKCAGHRLNPFGVGTEKVEEAVAMAFPTAAVSRLDRDIARKRGALEEILASFRSGDIDILVGTQMVAKGLDFPNVTLVGVIAADISLNIPDFRASERTFQLLSQVAGRAGRGSAPGHVIVQTFNPQNIAITTAQAHDYDAFYRAALQEREEAGYSPFSRLVNVVFSAADKAEVLRAGEAAVKLLEAVPDAIVLGPADCAIERLQGNWRRHVLVKLPPDASVEPVGEALQGLETKAQVMVDVNPYSLV